jgi:hypothetical protein
MKRLFLATLTSIGIWLSIALLYTNAYGGQQEFNSVLMESTFKIVGMATPDPSTKQPRSSVGTAFLVGRPKKADPSHSTIVMVTAGHVVDEIVGDDAFIILRKKNADGSFTRLPHQIKIRDKGSPLFVHHPVADVVAMYISVPDNVELTLAPTSLLAEDKDFEHFEIHPGDELLCLGYPLGVEASEAGFPILRSGKIASYPITPAKKVKSFLYDFRVFPGNSGGPVYFYQSNRTYEGKTHLGETIQFIAGLVSEQSYQPQSKEPLILAVVVPAQFILETVNLLPEK